MLAMRAVDGQGQTQIAKSQGSFPDGATGLHRIRIELTDRPPDEGVTFRSLAGRPTLGRLRIRNVEGREGFEPSTLGLKVPCSAAELPAHMPDFRYNLLA